MTDNEKPQGGVRLDMAFGERSGAIPTANAETAFRLLIVGDFAGRGDGAVRDISGEDIASLLASFGAVATIEVPNRLGSTPPALAVRLPIASLRDLDPKTLPSRIPEIANAERLATATASTPPAPTAQSTQASAAEDSSIDRLLDMIDIAPVAQPDAAKAAVSAFVASMPKSRPAHAEPQPTTSALSREQVREVATHARWRAVEAAWRSLRLLLMARASRAATRLVLCDVPHDRIADLLSQEDFAQTLAREPEMTAILVVGAFGTSAKDLDALDRIAQAAAAMQMPILISLAQDFFGAPPEKMATMDNPGALLETPAYAAWRGLRGRDESRLLFAAWNDIVLRPAAGEAPILWGEPGVILAAQILRSLARINWPTEILGADSAFGGLDLAEVETRGARKTAIPLRAPLDAGVARDLGNEGIACLVCRPDRDEAWFTRAPSVHGLSAMAEAERKVMESFNSLPFCFVSRFFQDLLQNNSALLSSARSGEAIAANVTALLEDVLLTTGPGSSAHAAHGQDENGNDHIEVSIRLGKDVMNGFAFSFDMAME
ncbi:type VI secretion system contractile sheath large subunit [Microbacteriaceae bacterium K1510]|nr:type VI secretion system contractile sheath large subunit [Microbacteriaceae bacterium K1510]